MAATLASHPFVVVEDHGHETPCYIWTGCLDRDGYAQVHYQGKRQFAHRVFFTLEKGEIPEGFDLDHLCRVRCCVRPDHLEPVLHVINIRRGAGTKLNQRLVDLIRASSATHTGVAKLLGVHPSTILRIRSFEKWKPVA